MAEPMVDAEYLEQIAGARRELYRLMAKQNCAPIMLRLAWSDAGTYDVQSKTGGPNGSIRMAQEYTQAANLGLESAIDMCEEVKSKHPKITYADLYQLAGVVAVAFCGGPTIDFIPGRQDSIVCSREGRLPDAKQGLQHLRDVFYRMGLSDKDTVALSGAHTLGRAHPERSGFDGPWTRKPLLFDNSYFMELQKKKETDGLLKLPTDKALVEDPEFHYHVRRYAESVSKFHKDYKKSHKKFSELGFNPSSVAAEDAVAAPDQNREVLQRIFERDVVKKRETGAIGLVLADKVFPIAQAESFSLQPDALTLVDRTFRIGDTVSRVGETVTKVGVVVAARKVVDLEDSDGDRLVNIQTDRIERIRGFFKDDLVIFESSWVGRVTATEFRFKLKFNNGGKMEWADPDPRALVPVFTNACEKVINVPYYLGQTVQKKPLKDDEPVVAGVVTLHKDRGLRVSWDEAERARSLCVPELVRATEVRRLMVPSAAHAGWMLGQRCLFNGEEYVICNVHPSTVTVRWKNGLEDEIEGRELVRADKPAGGFYEGSKFQIGQFVSRLEMGGLPNYGMVKGISGRCVKVEWEDGSIGTVDPEDIDIERGPDGEYYGGDTDEDGEEHGGDDADEEYGDGDRNADGSREEENDAGHAASDSEENGDWTSDEESDAVHIPSESEADSDDGGMVTESD